MDRFSESGARSGNEADKRLFLDQPAIAVEVAINSRCESDRWLEEANLSMACFINTRPEEN